MAVASSRNWYVDLLRVFGLFLVILGHWLTTSVAVRGGQLQGDNALAALLPWSAWPTLLFQVMPLFFLAGGYANAASWPAHHRRGESWASWLYGRAERLLRPTTLYLVIAAIGVTIARSVGVDPADLHQAAAAIAIQLWFLPVYLALVLLTPLLVRAHQRWGLRVPAAVALAATLVDAVRLSAATPVIGWANYLLVWGTAFALGIAWREGALTRRWFVGFIASGSLAFAALVWLGPFPLTLIGVPGERIDNTAPPSVALLAYSVAQVGVVLMLERPVLRWLRKPGRLVALIRANSVVMTVYLWHMVPVVVAAPLLYSTGLLSEPAMGSWHWWELRLPWVALLVAMLALIVSIAGRWELPRSVSPPQVSHALVLLAGVVIASVALVRLTIVSFDPTQHLPLAALAAYAIGIGLLAASTHDRMNRLPTRALWRTFRQTARWV
jgi:surface polysaccharide O-acyltransferase-like enzyme